MTATVHEDAFEANRGRLMALAYRMTGSVADSEDVLQEAYLRWEAVDTQVVRNPRAFLSTTVTRLCLDLLKSARVQRESYVGPWLPEPVLDTHGIAPDDATELAQDISVALMLALERLSPLERAAFLLHEVFDCSYEEVANTLGRSEAACRQLASRAKKHVRAARPRYEPSDDERRRIVLAFGNAVMNGDLEELQATLADDAVLYADGGGKVFVGVASDPRRRSGGAVLHRSPQEASARRVGRGVPADRERGTGVRHRRRWSDRCRPWPSTCTTGRFRPSMRSAIPTSSLGRSGQARGACGLVRNVSEEGAAGRP